MNEPGLAALDGYLKSGQAVAFLGDLASAPLYPVSGELINDLITAVSSGMKKRQVDTYRALARQSPEEVVEIIRHSLGVGSYRDVLRRVLRARTDPATGRSWTPVQELVCRCAFKAVVTTGYDPGITDARMWVRPGAMSTGFTTWQDELGLDRWRTGDIFGDDELPVLFAHGQHNRPDSVVLATTEYRRAYAGKLPYVLARLVDSGHLIWIGFGFADQRIAAILREIADHTGTRVDSGGAPRHVAIMPLGPGGGPATHGSWPAARRSPTVRTSSCFRPSRASAWPWKPCWLSTPTPVSRPRRLCRPRRPCQPWQPPRPAVTRPPVPRSRAAVSPMGGSRRDGCRPPTPSGISRAEPRNSPGCTAGRLIRRSPSSGSPPGAGQARPPWSPTGLDRKDAAAPGSARDLGWSFYADPSPEHWATALLDWAQQKDFPRPPTAGRLAADLLRLLRSTPLLLVLDGLEVIQESPAAEGFGRLLDGLLREVLAEACQQPGAGLLVLTSRFPFADLEAFDGGSARMLDDTAVHPGRRR